MEVFRFKLLTVSNLVGGGWVKTTGVGGLWVTGGALADAGVGVATVNGVLTEAIDGGVGVIADANLLALKVRFGPIGGALATAAGVFGGAVVELEVVLSVDLIAAEA